MKRVRAFPLNNANEGVCTVQRVSGTVSLDHDYWLEGMRGFVFHEYLIDRCYCWAWNAKSATITIDADYS